MKLGRSLNAAANKDPVFPPQKKHQLPLLLDVCFGSSSQQGAKWWRMNPVCKGSPQAPVAMVETAEAKFSIAAAHWGLELMSAPANVACHQNPIGLLVQTVSCSGNFPLAPHRSSGDWSVGGWAEESQEKLQSLRPDDKYSLHMFRFFVEEHVFYLLCLPATMRSRLGNQTQLEGLVSQSRAGNGAGPLPATFIENVDRKAMCSLNSAPPPPLAVKVLSSFHFIYSNSPKSDCSKQPALDWAQLFGSWSQKITYLKNFYTLSPCVSSYRTFPRKFFLCALSQNSGRSNSAHQSL